MQYYEMQVQNVRHVAPYQMKSPTAAVQIDFYPTLYANNPKSADNFDQPMNSSNELLLACHCNNKQKSEKKNIMSNTFTVAHQE